MHSSLVRERATLSTLVRERATPSTLVRECATLCTLLHIKNWWPIPKIYVGCWRDPILIRTFKHTFGGCGIFIQTFGHMLAQNFGVFIQIKNKGQPAAPKFYPDSKHTS